MCCALQNFKGVLEAPAIWCGCASEPSGTAREKNAAAAVQKPAGLGILSWLERFLAQVPFWKFEETIRMGKAWDQSWTGFQILIFFSADSSSIGLIACIL